MTFMCRKNQMLEIQDKMKCPSCQTDPLQDANFCHRCGWMIRPYCIPCRLPLPADSQYCARCGLPLLQVAHTTMSATESVKSQTRQSPSQTIPTSETTPQPREQSPSAQQKSLHQIVAENISDSLREKFQKAKEAIEGERKLVTVLFADISGFTAMSETMDPEQVTDIINVCFKRLGAIVYKYEGYIDKFMGDCIMALFGAPIAHENDPELALLCASEMLEQLQAYNCEKGLDLGMSIGVNSGMVVAGGVGTNEKFDYTVMGDAVNLAQRLQSAAKRNQILVSKPIYRTCERTFDFNTLDPINVKGKRDKVDIFELVGKKKKPLRERGLHVGFGKLIGRKNEVQIAERLLDDIQRSNGQILCVSGEAGVGKSRLKHEIKKSTLRLKLGWYEGRCSNLHQDTSYFVFIDILKKVFQIEDGDEVKDTSQGLPTLQGVELDKTTLSFIEELLNKKPALEKAAELDASQKKSATFIAIKKLFMALASQTPMVLFFDDLHWIDPLSKELLSYLMDSVQHNPMLIYSAFRPEFKHDWHDKRHYTQLSLGPLTPEESLALVQTLLELETIPQSLQNLIESKSEGNPLYIEEIIKTLIDSEKIVKKGDQWSISETVDQFEMPQTLQGLIATRIDKLDEVSKKIIQYASVVGKHFQDRLISEASKLPDDVLYEGLQNLRKKELIFEIASKGDIVEYVFNHTLTQEVAYATILTKKQKIYHGRVAEAIEHLYQDQITDHLHSLALHYTEADNKDKAIEYLFRSGKQMALDFNNSGSLFNFEKALEFMATLVNTNDPKVLQENERLALYVDILFEAAEVYLLIGKYDKARTNYQKVLPAASAAARTALEADCYRRMGDLERICGHVDAANEALHVALEKATQANHFEYIVRIHKSLGNVASIAHSTEKALEYFEKGLNGARSLNDSKLISEYLNDIGTRYIYRHDLEKAEASLLESKEIAAKCNHKSVLIRSVINLGVVHYYKNDLKGALEMFKEGADISEKIGDARNLLLAKHNIGDVLLQFGQHNEALSHFQESYNLANEIQSNIDSVKNLVFIGYIKTKLGAETEGEKLLNESVAISQKEQYWEYFCVGHYYLGLFMQEHNRFAEAKEHLTIAVNKALEIGSHSMAENCKKEIERLETKNGGEKDVAAST